MKTFIKFFLITAILFPLSVFAQDAFYTPDGQRIFRTAMVGPKAYNTNEPPDVVVISSGAFDNYRITTSTGFAETHIAVNPLNPLNFVATDNRTTGFSLSGNAELYNTTDGGISWTPHVIPIDAGDPVFAFDN